MSATPTDAFTAAFDHFDCDFTIFAPTLLDDVARPGPGDTGPVRLTGYTPISRHAADLWLATQGFVRDAAAQADLTPLVVESISHLLAAATLATFPNNALLDPTIEDRHDAHPATVRRAVAFIESNSDRPISVTDIAAAAFVTPRALQLAFRRHLGATPMAYLRRTRLANAHADLRAADPAATTVTTIAARWGFASSSRFTAQYRSAYGRPPRSTLHGD